MAKSDAEIIATIRAHIADGSPNALDLVRQRLRWPEGKVLPDLAVWLDLLAQVASQLGAKSLADVAREAARDPDSPDRLSDLGDALIDSGAPAIAASVLWHCLALVGDSEEVVCELVSALETALAYGDAYAILEQHSALRSRSFLCEYLYAFNAAMTGRLDITRAAFAGLRPDTQETEAMKSTIEAILDRADQVRTACPLDRRDLRGWQYVLTGTLVTHRSPYGFDDGMNGRYAMIADSASRVRTGVERLVPLVVATGAPCVYAGPNPADDVVAQVVATRTKLPLMPWPAIGTPTPGVIAIYDLATLRGDQAARLAERRADQILYAHASPWTLDAPVAPDVTTILYQSLAPLTGVTAEAILADPGLEADELIYEDLQAWDALAAAAWPVAPARRSRMWAGGPVGSNRFL